MANFPVVQPADLGSEFDLGVVTANKITLLAATTAAAGKVALASSGDITSGTTGKVIDAAQLKAAIAGLAGGLNYQGAWNPTTNASPQLLSGVGTKGYLYKLAANGVTVSTTATAAVSNSTTIPVSSTTGLLQGQAITGSSPANIIQSVGANSVVVGTAVSYGNGATVSFSTYLDGFGPFYSGDYVTYDGTTYDKFDGPAEAVTSVAGRIGAITLTPTDVPGVATPSSVTAQATVLITNSFGVTIGHALP